MAPSVMETRPLKTASGGVLAGDGLKCKITQFKFNVTVLVNRSSLMDSQIALLGYFIQSDAPSIYNSLSLSTDYQITQVRLHH